MQTRWAIFDPLLVLAVALVFAVVAVVFAALAIGRSRKSIRRLELAREREQTEADVAAMYAREQAELTGSSEADG